MPPGGLVWWFFVGSVEKGGGIGLVENRREMEKKEVRGKGG